MAFFVVIHIVIMSISIFYVVANGFNIFICHPREKYWNPLMTTGSCYSLNASIQAMSVFNVVSDFVILLLPVWPIWILQVPRANKVGMLALFATGML